MSSSRCGLGGNPKQSFQFAFAIIDERQGAQKKLPYAVCNQRSPRSHERPAAICCSLGARKTDRHAAKLPFNAKDSNHGRQSRSDISRSHEARSQNH
jgi:hypothetical protein